MDPLLRDVALRVRRDARVQQCSLVVAEVGTERDLLAQRAVERLDQQMLDAPPCIVHRSRLAEPPGCDRRQLQRLAEQLLAERRQIAEQCARLEHAGAERVGEHHRAAARAIGEAGNAERRVGTQLERVAVVVVLAAQDRVHALQPFDGLQPDAAIAHREVAAFDEREAEVAREQRVLEVGFVVRARREQHDLRRSVATRRPAQQRVAQRGEERREALHMQLAKHLRKDARDDEPVLERVAGTRRRLRAIARDPPVPVGRAREVGGVVQQVHAARRTNALHLMQITAVAEHHRRRDRARAQQLLWAVDVGQHAVQQIGALRDAGFDDVPFGGRQQQRQRVDFPWPIGALRIGIHVIGDAVLADLALHQRQGVVDFGAFAVDERAQERIPVRARCTRPGQQLVVAVFECRVA